MNGECRGSGGLFIRDSLGTSTAGWLDEMRTFWVKRGEWVIGPVTEHQIRTMARQQWFRANDLVGVEQDGPWTPARTVVPSRGFNAEHTVRRESPLEPAEATPAHDAATRPAAADRALTDRVVSEAATAAGDARPTWFQSRRRQHRRPEATPESPSSSPADDTSSGTGTSESTQPSAEELERVRRTRQTGRAAGQPLVDDLFGGPSAASSADSGAVDRFHTAELAAGGGALRDEVASDADFDSAVQAEPPRSARGRRGNREAAADGRREADARASIEETTNRSSIEKTTKRPSISGDWDFDLAAGLASEDDEPVRTRPLDDADAGHLPDQLELDGSDAAVRKPVTDWELVIGDLDDEEEHAAAEAAPFSLSVHSLKTGKALSAAESAASAELDFARLAHLAAADPRLSRSELPAAADEDEPPPPLMTPEERALRRSIGGHQFQTLLSALCLTLGLQACTLSAVINGVVYVALRRFFLLSTEVFFPWGTGSLEILEGADLALAGTAMAVTFSLPFLALSYLIRVDGRVLFYLISLGAALLPAIVIGSGGLNAAAGIVFACLLFVLPAVVAAVLSGMLATTSDEQTLKQLLLGAAGTGVLAAVSIGFAAPNFSIEYLLRELPPELRLSGGLIYVAVLCYSAQLTLVYFVLDRIARTCLDESTQRFVEQHLMFHWLLTFTAFVLIGAVHAQAVTGWGTAPILLGGLTAVVALGFNLWSLVGHLEPRFDRLRIDD